MKDEQDPVDSLIHPLTYQRLQHHLSIIRKIILAIAGHSKCRFPPILLYQISKFIFPNPLLLKQGLFCLSTDNILTSNSLYLIVPQQDPYCQADLPIYKNKFGQQTSKEHKNRKSAYVSIVYQWKAITISQHANYNEILQKGALFMAFLSNIKLHPLDYQQEAQAVPGKLLDNYKLQLAQKQKNKHFHLVSDNLALSYLYLQQIYKYKKDKKINDLVIKAFSKLMTKHMLALKIDKNYNTADLGFEEKYLIVQHHKPLPVTHHRNAADMASYPCITREGDHWKLKDSEGLTHFLLYKELRHSLSRKKGFLITPCLRQIEQNDVWIKQANSTYPFDSINLHEKQHQA